MRVKYDASQPGHFICHVLSFFFEQSIVETRPRHESGRGCHHGVPRARSPQRGRGPGDRVAVENSSDNSTIYKNSTRTVLNNFKFKKLIYENYDAVDNDDDNDDNDKLYDDDSLTFTCCC